MRKTPQKITALIIIIVVIAAVIFGTLALIALFGGSIMKLFGFRYESFGSIVVFFAAAGIISAPVELFAQALPNALFKGLKRLTLKEARVLYIILDTIATALGLSAIDGIMRSVSASGTAIIVVSFVLALVTVREISEDKE